MEQDQTRSLPRDGIEPVFSMSAILPLLLRISEWPQCRKLNMKEYTCMKALSKVKLQPGRNGSKG
jgi:hypothetical protein